MSPQFRIPSVQDRELRRWHERPAADESERPELGRSDSAAFITAFHVVDHVLIDGSKPFPSSCERSPLSRARLSCTAKARRRPGQVPLCRSLGNDKTWRKLQQAQEFVMAQLKWRGRQAQQAADFPRKNASKLRLDCTSHS